MQLKHMLSTSCMIAAISLSAGAMASVQKVATLPNSFPYTPPTYTLGGSVLYIEHTAAEGTEWRYLDIASGQTALLKDINPGTGSFSDLALAPLPLTPVTLNGRLYFWANAGTKGEGLWSTDGTPAGTRQETSPTADGFPTSYAITRFQTAKGKLYISITTTEEGAEGLWSIDPGSGAAEHVFRADARISDASFLNGKIYLSRDSSFYGSLWEIDQASKASRSVIAKEYFPELTFGLNGHLYSYHQAQSLLAQIDPASGASTAIRKFTWSSGFSLPVLVGDTSALIASHGTGSAAGSLLWKTDGTVAGTTQISNGFRHNSYSTSLLKLDDKVLYAEAAGSKLNLAAIGMGAGATKEIIKELESSDDGSQTYMSRADNAVFVIRNSGCCLKIWKTDGTTAGTKQIMERSSAGIFVYPLGGSDSKFYFLVNFETERPMELWAYEEKEKGSGGGGGGSTTPALLAVLLTCLAFSIRTRRARP